MSTGRIMTLSVQSLNKLYFQFIQTLIVPLLHQPTPEITKLLHQRTAYQVHRYLEELLTPASAESNIATLNGSVGSLGNRPLAATNTNLYNYSLSSSAQQTKNYQDHRSYDNSLQKKSDERKSNSNKMGLRKALTGNNFEQRIKEFKSPQVEEKSNNIGLTQSIGNDSLLPIPSLGSQSLSSDFKTDFQQRQKVITTNINGSASLQKKSKSKTMKQCVQKISKLFNDSHSKIQKYSKKMQSQNKLYTLNFSTKMQKKQESVRIPQYQFHAKDKNIRKF